MGENFLLSLHDVWGEMINTLRSIPSNIKIWIYLACIAIIFFCLYKGFKNNFNPKNEKKRNALWFLPIFIMIFFIYMLSY